MSSFYDDLLRDLEEITSIENGNIEMEEIPNMILPTFAPKQANRQELE